MTEKKKTRGIDFGNVLFGVVVVIGIYLFLPLFLPCCPTNVDYAKGKAIIQCFYGAAEAFYKDTGQYPQQLSGLIKNPGLKSWKGPYIDGLEEIPKDPWGTPYQYRRNDQNNIIIISAGRDGKFGTNDDINKEDDE